MSPYLYKKKLIFFYPISIIIIKILVKSGTKLKVNDVLIINISLLIYLFINMFIYF